MNNIFETLRAAGFRHLLPIIPPGATVSSYSKSLQGREDMLGKVPGKRVSDGWVGLADWRKLPPAEEQDLAEWGESGAGVGLRCEDVAAVDIDIPDATMARVVRGLAYTWLGIAPARTGNPPKLLLLYRLSTPGEWPTKKQVQIAEGRMVEVLGSNQQFIISGEHPKTGEHYSWDCKLADFTLEALPVVDADDLRTFLDELSAFMEMMGYEPELVGSGSRASRSPESLRAQDIGALSEAVACIPNTEDTTREDFVAMAHAVNASCGGSGEGLQIFTEWAERWPYAHEDGEIERVYDSAYQSTIGVQYLMDKAREHGYSSAGADFGAVPTGVGAPERKGPEGDAEGADSLACAGDDDTPPGFWDRWVYVNRIKRFVDIKNGAELDKENFDDLYVVLGDEQRPSRFLLEHRKAHNFADDVDYRPGWLEKVYWHRERGKMVLNRWRPGPAGNGEWDMLAAGDADLDPWLRLGRHLFPEERDREVLLDWMASLIQNPGEKPNWHPLVGSQVHGTGKDSFFAPLVRGLGDNVVTIRTSDLEGQWTWWAENVQLVIVSEVNSFERRAIMNRLKSYMAAPPDTIEINRKGVQQYEVPNLFGMLMFTNNPDAVAIEHSDRRFYVLWSEAGVLSPDFYAQYHRWLREGGAAAVYRYLIDRDISHFDAKGNAPATAAKEDMRKAALGAVEGTLAHAIENEDGPFATDIVAFPDIEQWIRPYSKTPIGPHKLALFLTNVGCVKLGRVRDALRGERVTVWACRRTEMLQGLPPGKLKHMLTEQREKVASAVADFETAAD